MWNQYINRIIIRLDQVYDDKNPLIRYKLIAFIGYRNYAFLRPATQSSTHGNMVAELAVDGIADNDTSLSHTASGDSSPWWKVQLAFPIWVTHVEVTNRLHRGK